MRKAAFPLGWALLVLVLPGCDIPFLGGGQGGGDPPQTGGTLRASAPPEYIAPSSWKYGPPPEFAPQPGAGQGGAPTGAAPKDPGRPVFDGDPRAAAPGDPPAVDAISGGGKAPPKYTAGPRLDTLSVNAPPPPGSAGQGAGKGKPTGGQGQGQGQGGKVSQAPGDPGAQGANGQNGGDGAGTLSAAGLAGPPDASGCPAGMARVDAFCVDRYESSLSELAGGGEEPWSPYQVPASGKRFKAVQRPAERPQAYISGIMAADACKNAGKRLCKPAEWTKACRGPANTPYPYGAAYQLQVCNEHDEDKGYLSTILRVYPNPGDNPFNSNTKMNDPRINQLDNGLSESNNSKYSKCTNGYGVFNMVGNLHEWIDDPDGTFQGGYYVDTRINGRGCAYRTTAHPTSYHDYSTGFRCCADAVK